MESALWGTALDMLLVLKGIFIAAWYCSLFFNEPCPCRECGRTPVRRLSVRKNRSETDRPGLPHAAQTKHMLCGRSVDGFLSKKLVDQDGTVWVRVYIVGYHDSLVVVFSSFLFFFFFSFLPCSTFRNVSYLSQWLFAAVHFSFWVNETFFCTQSKHLNLHTQPYQPVETFLCDPVTLHCYVITLFWRESRPANDYCSHCSNPAIDVVTALW